MCQVPENEERRQAMLQAACDTLAAACALPGVGSILTKEEQQSSSVRVASSSERAQALSLHALALHRLANGLSSEAQDVRFLTVLKILLCQHPFKRPHHVPFIAIAQPTFPART